MEQKKSNNIYDLNYMTEMSKKENSLIEPLTDETKYSIAIAICVMQFISDNIKHKNTLGSSEKVTEKQIKEDIKKWFIGVKNFDADFELVFNSMTPYLSICFDKNEIITGYSI